MGREQKRGIILLNGEPWQGEIDCENALVVCCDGALKWAEGKARIDVKAGDFDSLGYIPDNAIVYPSRKNFTDGEIALDILLKEGVREIEIYGGGGGREDHLFGNMQLLYAAHKAGAHAVLHTKYSDISCGSGKIEWRGMQGRTLSLAPVGERAHILESEGLRYPLIGLTLQAGSCRGVSNVIEADCARVECAEGALFIFAVREEMV